MNLAYHYPTIYWDTANLIVDSGSMNLKEKVYEELALGIDDIEVEDEKEVEDDEEEETPKKKIKNSSSDYGKLAAAIGKMKSRGIEVLPPDINKSDITFIPKVETNSIIYGIKGISGIGNQLLKEIIENRPYTSIEDFESKVKINKPKMVSLIKAGIFDSICDKSREEIMEDYLIRISSPKKRITLQNMNGLIGMGLIPENLDFERRLYNFNKYIKSLKEGDYYNFDEKAMTFYSNNYNLDDLKDVVIDGEHSTGKILISTWEKIYKKGMDPVRKWMKDKQQEILDTVNNKLVDELRDKYAEGNLSKWEMDSLNFYPHEHELENLQDYIYSIEDYFKLPDDPEVENSFSTKDGKTIDIYKISRIAGTVIDKNKNKGLVTLLTKTGVVTVKVWKNQFAEWDKRIFVIGDDGKKKVIEYSWFDRGTKLIITGIKRDNCFVPKKYKNTEFPLFEKINETTQDGYIASSVTERVTI